MKKKLLRQRGLLIFPSKGIEKGSSLVFLTITLGAVIFLLLAFIIASRDYVNKTCAYEVGNISTRSILSFYNRPLLEKYGILAFDMSSNKINKRVSEYSSVGISKKYPIIFNHIKSSKSEYTLSNIEIAKKELKDGCKFALANKVMKKRKIKEKKLMDKKESKIPKLSDKVIRNQMVINSLPSKGMNPSGSYYKGNIKDKSMLILYAINLLNNSLEEVRDFETFFDNEIEYIISGNLGDNSNEKSVERKIFLARNISNLAHIYAVPYMMEEVACVATLISGPGAIFSQFIVAEAWAFAESINDVKILKHGGKIPIVKTKESWAVDLDSIVTGKKIDRFGKTIAYIDNNCQIGMSYRDYLIMLLQTTSEKKIIYRILDLIQINIQGADDENFMIKLNAVGFYFSGDYKGKKYVFKQKY